MKKSKPIILAFTLTISTIVGVTPQSAFGQTIDVDVPNALAAMKGNEWEKAKVLFDAIIARDGASGKKKYGGQFGFIWYNKGYTELQLAKKAAKAAPSGGTVEEVEAALAPSVAMFTEAKTSFETCRTFPTDKKGENVNFFRALLYKGQSEQGLKMYAEAVASYKKFIKDRDPEKVNKDVYPVGEFNINMAICHFRLETPDLAGGILYFETALKNKDKDNKLYLVPNPAIVSAFKDFAAGAIKLKEEKVIIDFVNANRGTLTLDPYNMYQFIPFFRKYAAEAFSVGMEEAAFTLYALMPGSIEASEDIADYERDLVGFDKDYVSDVFLDKNAVQSVSQIRRDLEHVKASIRKGEPHELLALRSLAFTHENEGYVRGAYNAYKSMEKYYTMTEGREVNLFNLVRTSSLVGEVLETEKFGQRFLKLFPGSEYKNQVKKMMLISIFYSGEYEIAHQLSSDLIGDLAENTESHDLCLHVLGGSKFYLGKFYDAHGLLEQHVRLYPKSAYKIAAQYFRAANFSRIEDWENAATYLDKFLADFPDSKKNIYIPFALYERGNVHFAQEELTEAIEKLDKLEREFPSSAVEDIAFNLRGDVHRALKEKPAANDYYIKARDLARRKGNDIVVEEALYKLVALHGNEKIGKELNPHIKDAVLFYDEFWKEFPVSQYKTQVAVAGLDALSAAGRNKEALTNVQGCISTMAKKDFAPGLEQAINTYGKYFLKSGNTPDQLKSHFETFPGVDAGDEKARALLQVAVIGVYEDVIKDIGEKNEDPKEVERGKLLKTKIGVLFADMDKKFNKEDLSDFILMRLADFIAERTGDPRKALPYYNEVLSRKSRQFRLSAQFGVANILAKSDNPAEQAEALNALEVVLATKDLGRDKKEKALYSMIEVYNGQGNWDGVFEKAKQYNRDKYSTGKSARVGLLLAEAYEKKRNAGKALATYVTVFQRYKSDWTVSIPALTRSAELTRLNGKKVNGVAPKQIAYDMAAKFIRGSSAAYEENKLDMPDVVRTNWESLRSKVQGWESEAGIISLEKQRKAKGGK